MFTPVDLASVSKLYESINPWLETQLAEQEKLSESDDPVLTVAEINSQIKKFEPVLNRLYERILASAEDSNAKAKEYKKNKPKGKKTKDEKKEQKGEQKKEEEKKKDEEKKDEEDRKDEL